MHSQPRVAVIGPTSMPWEEIADDVQPDLERLRAHRVEVVYVVTGGGPRSITTDADEHAAAPFVVSTAEQCERDGFDAVIVDCTGDPGLAEARTRLRIPIVGAGEAVRRAAAGAPPPVVVLSGDELRAGDVDALLARAREARTVVLGGTGWSHLVPLLASDGRAVLDPLDVALEQCLALLADQAG